MQTPRLPVLSRTETGAQEGGSQATSVSPPFRPILSWGSLKTQQTLGRGWQIACLYFPSIFIAISEPST